MNYLDKNILFYFTQEVEKLAGINDAIQGGITAGKTIGNMATNAATAYGKASMELGKGGIVAGLGAGMIAPSIGASSLKSYKEQIKLNKSIPNLSTPRTIP